MKKWEEISEEERREWRQSPVTQAAIAMLRDVEAQCRQTAFISAHSEPVDLIRFKAGITVGVSTSIDRLTTEKK